jgi:uncharacterized damage-inducible protein DinB
MSVRNSLLPDFDHEMALTRHLLERLPDHAFAWRPHEMSYALGGLATHLAQLPRWGNWILDHDSYDLAESGKSRATEKGSRAEVLELFDAHVAGVRRGLVEKTEAELLATWSLKRDGHLLMSLPRLSALRYFLIHHMIHHRGQMTVYLRMQGVPLPPMYGPTADEGM